jgi:hypothetical protein
MNFYRLSILVLVTGNNALVDGQALKIISWLLEIMPW